MSDSEQKLTELRSIIDSLDSEIIAKIQERARVGSQIGEIKRQFGGSIYRPDREREVYEKVKSRNPGPLPDSVLIAIYREIMSGTIALEKSILVGYLGPEGSFSHEATKKKFGSIVASKAFPSIPDVFKSVESGRLDYGMVPVENSTEGSVGTTLDYLIQSELYIYSEMYMPINFHLLGYEKDISKIQRVYGIRIGNEQCRDWLHTNLPNVEIVETSSTAMAAKIVSQEKKQNGFTNSAAIASSAAGELYQLEIIEESIEDISGNTTRFFVLGKDQCPATGNDKTSIVFSIHDKPGMLLSVLQIFERYGLNLTKMESRPSRRNLWDYNFYTDFSGHVSEPKIQEVLEEVKKITLFLKVLGSYPAHQNRF